ncbi:MAG: ABC transporter permease [Rhodanobacter sp.]
MFGHYIHMAVRSLRRSPILTTLMVLAIGLGIGASMTMLTVLHVMDGDPLPGRSAHLYRPYLNPLPLAFKQSQFGPDPSLKMTWPDAMALLQADKAVHQAAMAGGNLDALPSGLNAQPKGANGRYTTRDFFAMFGVSFVRGSAWSVSDDAQRARVVVLTQTLARHLFGAAPAVGRAARLGGHDFQVVGVVTDWRPRPLFYADAQERHFSAADEFFMPLSTALDLKRDVSAVSGWGKDSSMTSPTVSWLQFWVQLDTSAQVAAYRQFLFDYAVQQKSLGHFERPPGDAHVYGLMDWLTRQHLVPDDVRLQTWLALGFLFVCMVNIVALLLAKFLRRGGEISVRRALGARRRDVFAQFAVESVLIGVAGGTLGLLIVELGLWSVRQRPDDYAHLAQMDPSMLLGTFVLAVLVSVLAGLLPAWRACRIAPALQLKTL